MKKSDKVIIILNNDCVITKQLMTYINNKDYDVWSNDYINDVNLKLVGCVTTNNLNKLLNIKKSYNLNFEIVAPFNSNDNKLFKGYLGYSTSNELIHEAILRQYCEIYLVSNSFKKFKDKTINSNQLIQFRQIINTYNMEIKDIANSVILLKSKSDYYINPSINIIENNIKDNIIIEEKNIIKGYENNNHFFNLYNDLTNKLQYKFKDKELNFLILGNDPTLNNVNSNLFKKDIKYNKLITIGINRTWRKVETDILYFMDGAAIEELDLNNQKNMDSFWITSEFMFNNPEMVTNYYDYKDYIKKNNIYILKNPKMQLKKSSVIWIIYYLFLMFSNFRCKFYLYGMSLNIDNGHFWTDEKNIVENKIKNKSLLQCFFNSQINGINFLFNKFKVDIVSISKDSKLNYFLPYIEISSLNDFIKEFKN